MAPLHSLFFLISTAAALSPVPQPRAPANFHRSFVPIASARTLLHSSTYVARASIGTPPQPLLLSIDTASDVAWLPCFSPVFSPNLSSSFHPLPCNSLPCSQAPNHFCPSPSTCTYNLSYAASSISSLISTDSLSLAGVSIPAFIFGCVTSSSYGSGGGGAASTPPQGLLGLGRGPLSFLSQTRSLYASTFSYCLPSFGSTNFTGTLRLGLAGQPARLRTTPLLSNPRRPSLYYVNMTGVRVGRREVRIAPAALGFDPATGAGTIIDSGTMYTQLVSPAYAAVRDEFRRRVNATVSSLGGFDTCYVGKVVLPTITFVFDGMMTMTLTEENTVIRGSGGGSGIVCFAMSGAGEKVNSVLNVIASAQQQNHRVLFDLPNARIGIARELCTS